MPPTDRRPRRAALDHGAERVSELALLLLALSLLLAPAGVAAALLLLWLGFAGRMAARWRGPRAAAASLAHSHPVVWLTALFVLYCLMQTLLLHVLPTGGPPPDPGTAADWARLAVFVPAAYVIAARPERLPLLLLLALIGLAGGMLLRLDWDLLLSDAGQFIDKRAGFGFGAIAFGLYGGTALLGLILLRRDCWLDAAGRPRWWRLLLWSGATALVLQGLVMTKSRGAWLAFAVALALGLLLQWRRRAGVPTHGGGARGSRAAAVILAGVLAALAVANAVRIGDRVAETLESARAMAAAEPAADEDSSMRLRWHAQLIGIDAVAARPWLGWGAGTAQALMGASNDPAVRYEDGGVLKHLHNSYLEAAVELGLPGLALFLAIQLGLLAALARRLRGGGGPAPAQRDLLVFLLAALVLLLVWELFDYRVIRQDWRGYWTLVAGGALGVVLRPLGRLR
jgi:O-antigen ligase